MLGAIFVQLLLGGLGGLLFYPMIFVIIVVAWSTAAARRGLGSKAVERSATIGFAIGTITIGSLVVLAMSKSADRVYYKLRPPDPKVLGQELVTIVKCNYEFAALHPASGYAESLSQMGPAGDGCLPQDFLVPERQGFLLAYQHGVKQSDGKITCFTITAEQAPPHGADFSRISTDESGMVVYSYQGPQDKGTPLLYSPVAGTIDSLIYYLRIIANTHKKDVHTADLYIQKDMANQGLGVAKGAVRNERYDLTYRFDTDASGTTNGFAIEARPCTYGGGGIRSYPIVFGLEGGIHTLTAFATPEDRPANTSDPLAYMCEIKPGAACTASVQLH